jgi:hypothetical protein
VLLFSKLIFMLHENFQAAFEEFGVMPEIIKALEELGWELPRDIQAEAIPLILGGGDVMAVRTPQFHSPPILPSLAFLHSPHTHLLTHLPHL